MNKKTNKYLSGNVILRDQQILGPLVLGDCNSALDVGIIKANRIMTIISIGIEAQPPKNKIPPEIDHYAYDIHDNKQQKISVELLEEVFEIIEKGRTKGGVLVHCYAGVSRSSSFVIAYLIRKHLLSYDQAKEKAKKQRPCVHPGDGFIRQLQYYAKVVFKRQEERLAELNKKREEKPEFAEKLIEVKEGSQNKVQIAEKQPTNMAEKAKRGVRGAVRSAQNFSSQKLKSSLMEKSSVNSKKMQEIREEEMTSAKSRSKQKEQKTEKLPPIHRQPVFAEGKYQRSSSRVQIKQKIDKIEGRASMVQAPSIRGIYGNKTKVM